MALHSCGRWLSVLLAAGACKSEPTAVQQEDPPPVADREDAIEAKTRRLRSYREQLARLDKRIAAARGLIERNRSNPAGYDQLAAAYLQRARLTGRLDDYAEAEAAIEGTFEHTSRPAYLARARLNYALHRLDRVQADLDAAAAAGPKATPQRIANGLVFDSNLAFARGEYARAKMLLGLAKTHADGHHVKTAGAILAWKTGDFAKADALLEQAIEAYGGRQREPVAWMHLHRGLLDLDRGRLDEALAHYRTAHSELEGYWLVDEHIAEVLTLQGETEQAKALYLDIIARTDNPEFMDAMAEILREEGEEAQAQAYIERAEDRYREQLKRYPEAAYGHALEHVLAFDEDPSRGVELARKNHALRPNAEAKTLLARAYVRAGELGEAVAAIEAALDTPYSTIELHRVAAEVFRAAGDDARSREQLARARTIDPGADLEDR